MSERVCVNHCMHDLSWVRNEYCTKELWNKASLLGVCGHVCTFSPQPTEKHEHPENETCDECQGVGDQVDRQPSAVQPEALTTEEAATMDNYCPRCRIISHQRTHITGYCACGDEAWMDCCADQECSSCGLLFNAPSADASAVQAPEQATPRPDLDAIRKRCKAATPGPWRWADWDATFGTQESTRCVLEHSQTHGATERAVVRLGTDECESVLRAEDNDINDGDKRFIAHARTDIPALLDAYEAQAVRIRELEDALTKIANRKTVAAFNTVSEMDQAYQGIVNATRAALKPKEGK